MKTASSSMELFFTSFCGEKDIYTPMPGHKHEGQNFSGFYSVISMVREAQSFGFKKAYRNFINRNKFFDHMPAHLIQNRISGHVWNNYFKFCFERNPWDKMISYYYWRTRKRQISFDDWLEEDDYCNDFNLYTHKNEVIVDYIARYEKLDDELEHICRIIGIEYQGDLKFNVKSNTRKVKSYRDFYSTEQKEKVGQVFRDEIELHGYKF